MHESSSLRKVRVQELRKEVPKFICQLYSRINPEHEEIILRSVNEILHILFDNSNGCGNIRRDVVKLQVPEALRMHTSLKQVNSLFYPVDTIFSSFFVHLGITKCDDNQPYLRTPLWNILGRLTFLPLALLRFDEARSLFLSNNFINKDKELRERLEFLNNVENSVEQQNDPSLLKYENKRLLDKYRQLFSIVSARVLNYDQFTNTVELDSEVIKTYAQICAMLREIEDDHIGLTNTDRYLLLMALLLTSNRSVIVSTTGDILTDWSLKKNNRNYPITKNPLMPVYFNLLLYLNDIQAGERNYLISSKAFLEKISTMSKEDLQVAIRNVELLSDAGIVIRHSEIPEELNYISTISGSGILFTYRYEENNQRKLFILARMNSTKANQKLEKFYDVFEKAEEVNTDTIHYYASKNS
ncbi:MAG: hypothetical protein QXO21_03075 [Candidatus Anstonellales archaeon]